ncbi:unnamed protein product [Candidula unifasciata]|uniref:Serpin domain-containing protein n=1 Tax=Candidula unifasciata TaxID=100452 RepID=A0A8S3ZI34_9EUPU|nr:unnamed protein product [Candidula unifasciata]
MSQNTLASANTILALSLFKVVRKDLKGKNAFLSPLSISAALSMTQLGAREKTAQEMAKVLGWESENGEQIHQQFQAYFTKLQQQSDQYQLSTANRIFVEKTFNVLETFTKQTKEWYLAEPAQANFKEQPEIEAAKINAWVAEQTQNKIKDLFAEGVINAVTRMVLVNAIYFKGKWDTEFAAKSTSPRPFKLSPEETKDVPTMYNKQTYGIYKDSELKFTAVELLYKGQELGMVIILPDEDFGLEELVENLTPERLNRVIKNVSLKKQKIQLYLPKFEITSTYRLKQALTSLGMADAFSEGRANFSGMTGQRDLVLSEVAHKAFVQVNEEGTEAAAATGAVMMMRSMPPPVPEVQVDHPFLFLISDHRADGSILFLGQVDNPLS